MVPGGGDTLACGRRRGGGQLGRMDRHSGTLGIVKYVSRREERFPCVAYHEMQRFLAAKLEDLPFLVILQFSSIILLCRKIEKHRHFYFALIGPVKCAFFGYSLQASSYKAIHALYANKEYTNKK